MVLARKDVGVAYHLAVVVDDALQGVTHVIRGQDLFEATHVQRLLQALLGLPTPAYRHHRLLPAPTASASPSATAAETLADLRDAGVTRAGPARPSSASPRRPTAPATELLIVPNCGAEIGPDGRTPRRS